MNKRMTSALAVLLLVVGSGAVGWFAGRQIESAEEAAARARPPEASIITVPVEMRALESKLVLRGSIRPADIQVIEFVPSTSADVLPVVTGIRSNSGDTVELGDVIIEVAERPVIALEGEVPAFRNMELGTTGIDVMQLEASLTDLGLDPGPVDGVFDENTLTASAALYELVGFPSPSATGEPVMPRSEVVFISSLPQVVDTVLVGYGERIEGPILTVSAAGLVVETSVLAADRDFVSVGAEAWIVQDDLGLRIAAVVIDLASKTSGLADFASFDVTAEAVDAAAIGRELVDLGVRLEIPLSASDGEVLVVPVSALSSGPDGTARLSVLRGSTMEIVDVAVGLTSGGLVEVEAIEPGALKVDDLVVVGADR